MEIKTYTKPISIMFVAVLMSASNPNNKIFNSLIPAPSHIDYINSDLLIKNTLGLDYNIHNKRVHRIIQLIKTDLNKIGYKTSNRDNPKINISIKIDPNISDKSGSYILKINSEGIEITGCDNAGIFYAFKTLLQILETTKTEKTRYIKGVIIKDTPRFKWRGMHLDVARHMFSVEFIKRYIDIIAMHKMNVFHWHLTEDQGWRIPIEKFPKLETISAWRKETLIGHYSDKPQKFDGKRYGGFYSKNEIIDIIKYAKDRFVEIVPEIEMPGHATAALSAYPELSCTGGPHKTETTWGVHKEVFCAGNEETFYFLEKILEEVSQIFPGPYIHIGGDECPKTRWKTCEKCQKRIKDEDLKDEHELQSYFIKRIEKILDKFGKRLIGWDEILEGGLAPNAIVHSWRGMEGGIKAANAGHEVIMSPTGYAYFDYYQSKNIKNEPLAIGGYLPLSKVYEFEPVPAKIEEDKRHLILGGQANLWTEYIDNENKAEYMLLPRMCALSEVLWTPTTNKNYNMFLKRLKGHLLRIKSAGYNFRELD